MPNGPHCCRSRAHTWRRAHAQVFDDKAAFNDWFGDALGGEDGGGADWLQEKRVVVIHRLHQILEPFMLRRQVQDVEGSLPEKVRGRRPSEGI